MHSLLLAFALLGVPSQCLGASLVGWVVRDAEPRWGVGQARVTLDTGQSAVSAADGHYYFPAVSTGTRTVTVERSGFASRQLSVAIDAGENYFNVGLSPSITLDRGAYGLADEKRDALLRR
jgi:hypothetical protein